jgi:hypothetical protein
MSTVAMVTAGAGVDPKGRGQKRGGSFFSPQPTIKSREKNGRRGTPLPSLLLLFLLEERSRACYIHK